jgi:hypothetical protein
VTRLVRQALHLPKQIVPPRSCAPATLLELQRLQADPHDARIVGHPKLRRRNGIRRDETDFERAVLDLTCCDGRVPTCFEPHEFDGQHASVRDNDMVGRSGDFEAFSLECPYL